MAQPQFDFIRSFEATRRFCRVAVDKHPSRLYQLRGAGAAQTFALAGEPFVDPATGVCFGDDDGYAPVLAGSPRPRFRRQTPYSMKGDGVVDRVSTRPSRSRTINATIEILIAESAMLKTGHQPKST